MLHERKRVLEGDVIDRIAQEEIAALKKRIAELELALADKTREDRMQIRHIGECEEKIKVLEGEVIGLREHIQELKEKSRELVRTITRLVTDRNYLQAELNRVCKGKP